MVEQDIPKRVVVVLLVLTVIVSFLGTVTFLEVYNSLSVNSQPGTAQATVKLTIQSPTGNLVAPTSDDTTARVAVNIKKAR